MSYHNWIHNYFSENHRRMCIDEVLNDIFHLLDCRAADYFELNKERYNQLYLDPEGDVLEDIGQKKLQIVQQIKKELHEFLKLLMDCGVKKVLQIGLGHWGSTHFMLSLICDKVVTVEYDRNNINRYVTGELTYNQNKELIIHGDSTAHETIIRATSDYQYDCLFIDGNHSYEYVKADYQNYISSVKSGGICAFHDALVEGDRFGTPKVLKELKQKHDIKYIIHSKNVGIAYFIKP